ncbi:MAG TPA: DUF2752 domain-containing protein [Pyrinomonadaceae bacterium]|nr:DUF2752 domain-containing protein [Pyrinomonadaceae bacterium]
MHEAVATPADMPGSSVAERILAAAGASGIVVGAAAVWYFDPTKASFFPVCPLYAMTGYACPGCGLTRGFHALFHGDVVTALDFNALLPMFAFLIGGAFVSMAYFAIRGRGTPLRLLSPATLWVFLVLLVTFGVARNLPWYPFTVLFP